MSTQKTLRGPLLCWDIFSMQLVEQAKNFNKQIEIDFLKSYKKQFGWTLNIEKLLSDNDFDALILTDSNQEIEWVNKGFTKMTGYPANFAKGKKPNFLQGEASLEETLSCIRKNLKAGIQFKYQIVNYRKNGTQYNCMIEIYPLKDKDHIIKHLLALEKEV